jgi:RNA polymerase sigma factor (sigma-70 family)
MNVDVAPWAGRSVGAEGERTDERLFGAADPARWPTEHGRALLVTARFLLRSEQEAQDLVQRTYELGIMNLGQLHEPGRVRGWLLAIETREAFRLARRIRRVVTIGFGDSQIRAVAPPDDELLTLRDAVRRLPDRTRTAVVLHYMTGLTVGETAGAMGVTANTVKTQLRLGLDRLREAFDDPR